LGETHKGQFAFRDASGAIVVVFQLLRDDGLLVMTWKADNEDHHVMVVNVDDARSLHEWLGDRLEPVA
jgi:hypothetical protein